MASNFKTVVQVLKELNYILTGKQKKKFFWLLLVIIVSAGLELVGVSAILPFVEAVISPLWGTAGCSLLSPSFQLA